MEVLEHLSYEEKWRSLGCSAWRREGSGESYSCVFILMEGIEQMEPGFSQGCLVATRGTDHNSKHGKFHLKLRKILFTLRMVNTNHDAQRSCGVSILGDNQSLTGHRPAQAAAAAPALSRGLDWLSPDVPSSLSCDDVFYPASPLVTTKCVLISKDFDIALLTTEKLKSALL